MGVAHGTVHHILVLMTCMCGYLQSHIETACAWITWWHWYIECREMVHLFLVN